MTHRTTTRALERIVRGFSCHRRIEILGMLEASPKPLSLLDVVKSCAANLRPISEHLRRLHFSGLVTKRSQGRFVMHELTDRGRRVIAFLKNLK